MQAPSGTFDFLPWQSSQPSWSVDADYLAAVAGHVFIQDGQNISLIDDATGEPVWIYRSEFASPSESSTIAVTDTQAVLMSQGVMTWLDLREGTEVDRVLHGAGYELRWLGGDRLLVSPAPFGGGTGAAVFEGNSKGRYGFVPSDRNILVAVAERDGDGFAAYNGTTYTADLQPQAEFGTESSWLTPAVDAAYVYGQGVRGGDHRVSLIDPYTGTEKWSIDSGYASAMVSVGMDGLLIFDNLDDLEAGRSVTFWESGRR